MVYGSCNPCGNSREECECSERALRTKTVDPRPAPVEEEDYRDLLLDELDVVVRRPSR